jgi:predicted ATP-grasp superfamily ATP-dependent carboligase
MHLKKQQSTQKNKTFIIVSLSSRSLAESATKTDNSVIALDVFNDLDLLKVAKKVFKIRKEGGNNEFNNRNLLNTVRKISNKFPIVYGSGFEDRPKILKKLGKEHKILGNKHETIERVKNPKKFFSVLKLLNINYPETRLRKPKNLDSWVVKKIGGSGGHHIAFANRLSLKKRSQSFKNYFFQKFIKGRYYSIHFASNKEKKKIIGITEQLQSASQNVQEEKNPFLLKRAIYVKSFNKQLMENLSITIDKIISHFGLIGLNSLDFILPKDSRKILVTEINPRPGVTLDLLEKSTGINLFDFHVKSICNKHFQKIEGNRRKNKKTWAMEIVYTKKILRFSQKIHWPPWVKDIPNLKKYLGDKTYIRNERPLCTVFADGNNRKSALKKLTNRVKLLNNDLIKYLTT